MTANRSSFLTIAALAFLLGACGSRDTAMAESVMEAKQAADRAEAAQNAAERAARQAAGRQQVAVAAEPEEEPQQLDNEVRDPDLDGAQDGSELYAPPEPPTGSPQQ